jgi:hypothetical protein
MRSPLPDSSNLEAGILEDARPSRLSRVHDNVRDLLRRSVFGSFASSPVASPPRSPGASVVPNPTTRLPPQQPTPTYHPAVSTTPSPQDVPGVLFPAWRSQPPSPPVIDDRSQVPAPPEHPDVSQNAMSVFLQQKELQRHQHRQHKAWKRPRSRKPRDAVSSVQWIICMVLGFAVLGLLGTCKQNHRSSILWNEC